MSRRMSHAARAYLKDRRVFENIENRKHLNSVLDYPANAQANIEKCEQTIEKTKNDAGLTEEEKAKKIAWCQNKIIEIKKSIELYYVQHPWVMR